MKNSRVSVIKNNIEVGDKIPEFKHDCETGQWIDQSMIKKGHVLDKNGVVDLPEFKVDNKSRRKNSNAYHTVGSMLNSEIVATPEFKDTRFYHKVQNQNQVTYDPTFMEVTDVKLVDFDIDVTQQNLADGYVDCRAQMLEGCPNKEIKSKNGWVVFDRYGHPNSTRMRITNTAMKKIRSLAATRDQRNRNFEGL
jgi:hypothetical protein